MKMKRFFGLIGVVLLSGCQGIQPELGVEKGHLKPCPDKPNCVSSQATGTPHFIAPIQSSGSPATVKKTLLTRLREWDGCEIQTVEDTYIRATFTSRVFRFVDDVEFYFPETPSNGTLIQVRSASRVGYSDLGVNRKRIETIRRAFKQ